jgi:hypothetical protein
MEDPNLHMSHTTHDRTALEALAQGEFGQLSDSERALVRAVPTADPAFCGPGPTDMDGALKNHAYLPEFSDTGLPSEGVPRWDPERNVRAELIRWLCLNREAKALVNPKGIQLVGARIVQSLDLRWTEIPFRVSLKRCRFQDNALFTGSQILELDLEGCWTRQVNADTIRVKQNLNLRYGFHADGLVRLVGAQIGGTLGCGESQFLGENGMAINADAINVAGSVLLRAGNNFIGKDGRKVRPFKATGQVRLEVARVGGDVDFSGGEFDNPYTDSMSDPAIDLEGAEIRGTLQFRAYEDKCPLRVNGLVDLRGASASGFEDDRDSWMDPKTQKPKKTLRLNLYGFVYNRITSQPRDAKYALDLESRLEWLSLDVSNTTQPYRQLAKIFEDSGDATGAKQIYKKMEALLSRANWYPKRFARWTIGYGYDPDNAVYALVFLTLFGWLLYWRAYRMGSITPTDQHARDSFKKRRKLPPHYPRFSPFFCSLENTFPLITFGQSDKWQADPEHPVSPDPELMKSSCGRQGRAQRFLAWTKSPRYMRTFIWIQIVLGWFLATLFVAGISGVVKH